MTSLNAGTLQAGAANVFSAGSAFTVAAGATLDLASFNNSIGSLAGGGIVTVGSATLTSGNDGTSTIFSGAIGGNGGLTKIGGGVLLLTGTSSYLGPTNINAGTLDVNGALASTVSVNSGGTLMGNGTVGGLTIGNGAIVAPGNSIGALHIAGNVGFSAGSVYQVQLNATQSDLIAATGHATLAGGNVQVSGTPAINISYTILTAQGGVSGMFAGVSAPGLFISPQLTYTPDSVLLSLQQARSFASAGATPNQINVAAALGTLPTNSSLFQAVLAQTSIASAQHAFDALSGEIHASTQTVMLDDSRYFRQAMLGRLRQAGFDGATGPAASLGFGGPQLQFAEPADSFAARFDPAVAAMAFADARPLKAMPQAAAPVPAELVWWTQGIGAWGQIDGNGNAAGINHSLGGVTTGVDRRLDGNWRVGIAGGYNNSDINDSSRVSSASIDTAQFGAYAGTHYGHWNFSAGAAASWSNVDTSRSILFPGFADVASARYGAATAQLFDEVGYSITFGAIAAEPFAGLAWVHLRTDGFNETGNTIAALTGLSKQNDIGCSTLGTRAATNTILSNGMLLTVRGSVAWQHALGDVTPDALLAFQGSTALFTVAGVPLARDAALIETGFDALITARTTIGISYTGQLAEGFQDHSIKADLRIKF